ncbi:MAG: TraR/DksA C4-type zinc finger protein [Planctomycetaceae bacterium]|nr:TraR/DksA C4-type zinc finger protein [Planctomycetaceae bacterium]
MARRDALLKLHRDLIAQRDELRRMLGLEIATGDGNKGDAGDVANDDAEREVNTQLAALESRELVKIERAIEAIRTGRYGTCEHCEKKIPIARLNALPYTTHCINCQRKQEERRGRLGEEDVDWEAAHEYQLRQQDRDLNLRDLDVEVLG